MKEKKLLRLVSTLWVLCTLEGFSAGEAQKPVQVDWSFKGMNGTFDRNELRRGLQVYREVCSACHGLSQLRYEKLEALGFSEADIKVIASNYEITGEIGDDGQPKTRPAEPKDAFVSPYPNEKAARAMNNGAYPVDLSLITKARKDGANYLYSLLTGYTDPPKGTPLMEGMYYNAYYAGGQIAMAPPLMDDMITYPDGTPATVRQMAHDVTAFLAWASEPEMESRKNMGFMILLYIFVFTCLIYALNRRAWAKVKAGKGG